MILRHYLFKAARSAARKHGEYMGFGFSGRTSLNWSKKENCYKNSTGSARVYKDYASSYAEKLVIIRELKTKHGQKTIRFENTAHFSPTTSNHEYYLKSHNWLASSDVTIKLDFAGSMNDLYYLIELNDKTLYRFENCEYNESLISFVNEYFTKAAAKKFLADKKAKHDKAISDRKQDQKIDRLKKRIIKLDFANEKNLMAAYTKYNILSTGWGHTDNLTDFFSRWHINASREKLKLFFDLISRECLKMCDSNARYYSDVLVERARLKIFSELAEKPEPEQNESRAI